MQTIRQLPEVRGVPVSSVKTALCDVERFITDKYLGIPYLHMGRTLDGLDCWGFLKVVYEDLGVNLFDLEDLRYDKRWGAGPDNYFKDNYIRDWDRAERPEVLDAVLFLNSRGTADHAGIVLGNRRFIHCSKAGVIISRLDDSIWKRMTEGFYRLKGGIW